MEIFTYTGQDFKAVLESGEWKIGILRWSERFSAFRIMERHLLTDEVFVLLEGTASLYESEDGSCFTRQEMQKNRVYNIPKNIWHHITVSENATVLVVENRNTSRENTQKQEVTSATECKESMGC